MRRNITKIEEMINIGKQASEIAEEIKFGVSSKVAAKARNLFL